MKNILLLTFLLAAFLASGQHGRTPSERTVRSKQKMDNFFEWAQPLMGQLQPQQDILFNVPELKNAAALQKLDSTIYRELDQNSGIWHNIWKDEYSYNTYPAVMGYMEKEWDKQEAKWKVLNWTEIDNNENGLPETYTTWTTANSISGELIAESKLTAHYSNSGVLDSILFWSYSPSATWVLESSMYYYYLGTGKIDKIEMIMLEEDEGEIYETVMVYQFGYDGQQRQISTVVSIIADDEEIIYSRTDYTWGSSGKITSYENSSLSFFTFTMEKTTRTELQYNQAGDVSVETESSWNSTANAWELSEKQEYGYGNINSSDVVFPNLLAIGFGAGIEIVNQFSKAPTSVNTFERVDNNWLNTGKTTFYYSGGTPTGLEEPFISDTGVYPNPFTDRLYFHWSDKSTELKVEVYSISGKRMIEQFVTPDNPIDTRHLPGGTYLYRLTEDGRLMGSGKLVRR